VVVNDKVAFKTVALGRDYGSSVEVKSGVEATDLVVVNPNDALSEGAAVRTVEAKQ
jgi:hypothetical protein